MTRFEAEIESLRREITDEFEEWRTVDSLGRSIDRALTREDSLYIRSAWKSLQVYQQNVDKENVEIPATSSPEASQEQVERFADEIAEAEAEICARRDALFESIVSKCREVLDTLCEDGATKKEQVITLKEAMKSDLAGNIVSEAVGCSAKHAGRFRWDEEEQVVDTREGVKTRRENRFSDSQKARIRRRDGEECVKCPSEDSLKVHHIIPVEDGGEGTDENGATLCKPCHDEIHRWSNGFGYDYETIEEFWEWANSGEE